MGRGKVKLCEKAWCTAFQLRKAAPPHDAALLANKASTAWATSFPARLGIWRDDAIARPDILRCE